MFSILFVCLPFNISRSPREHFKIATQSFQESVNISYKNDINQCDYHCLHLIHHKWSPFISLRLGHARGKTIINRFLTLSRRVATRWRRLIISRPKVISLRQDGLRIMILIYIRREQAILPFPFGEGAEERGG